ncbi:MAG: hypothetical protein AAB074_13000 [Planctomycetota bacterium]
MEPPKSKRPFYRPITSVSRVKFTRQMALAWLDTYTTYGLTRIDELGGIIRREIWDSMPAETYLTYEVRRLQIVRVCTRFFSILGDEIRERSLLRPGQNRQDLMRAWVAWDALTDQRCREDRSKYGRMLAQFKVLDFGPGIWSEDLDAVDQIRYGSLQDPFNQALFHSARSKTARRLDRDYRVRKSVKSLRCELPDEDIRQETVAGILRAGGPFLTRQRGGAFRIRVTADRIREVLLRLVSREYQVENLEQVGGGVEGTIPVEDEERKRIVCRQVERLRELCRQRSRIESRSEAVRVVRANLLQLLLGRHGIPDETSVSPADLLARHPTIRPDSLSHALSAEEAWLTREIGPSEF